MAGGLQTDPVFMAKFGLEPHSEDTKGEFPYNAAHIDELIASGDKIATERAQLGQEFFTQVTDTGKTWENLKDLGPAIQLVLCCTLRCRMPN